MKRYMKLALQLAASGALLWLLLTRVGFEEVLSRLTIRNPAAAGVAFLLLATQFFLGTLRWRMVCIALGVSVPGMRVLLGWVGMGGALSQILPSSIGGDGYRILALGRRAGIGAATRSVVAERVAGLLTLSAIALPFSLYAIRDAGSSLMFTVFGILSGAVLAGGAVAGVLARLLARWTASRLVRLVADDFAAMYSRSTLLPVFSASLAIHALSIGTVLCVGWALALDEIQWWQAALAVPGTLLAASIPISLGGWGIRESSMVLALAAFGVSDAIALTLSIGYGLAVALAAMIGILLWIAGAQGAASR